MSAVLNLPVLSGSPRQTALITLGDRGYQLTLDWNQRISRWFMDLATESGEYLLRAKGLATRADILGQIRYLPACPEGSLILVDLSGADSEASLYSLGVDHRLWYVTL